MSRDTQTTPTYPCPTCNTRHSSLTSLQTHYQHTHDSSWTAGYPSTCYYYGDLHKRKDAYDYHRPERHFCGNNCFHTWQRAVDDTSRENPDTTAGNPIKITCAYCGSTIAREPYKLSRGTTTRHFCNNYCQGKYRAEHFSGENHPDWRGGTELYTAISTLLSPEPWERLSKRARNKQPECEKCGKHGEPRRGHQNHAHHIIPVLAGGTHADDLLMTLCPSCHRKVEHFTSQFHGMERILAPATRRDDDDEDLDQPEDTTNSTHGEPADN